MDVPLPDIRRLEIEGPAGRLEARLDRSADGREPGFVAVFGHPHPQQGGTMFNNVVVHASRTLVHAGGAVLRFNFRGVGASAGHYDEGRGEREDYRAALAKVRELHPGIRPVLAAGFSFGSIRAMECSEEADLYLGVAPPISLQKYRDLPEVGIPAGLILAGADELVPVPDRELLEACFPHRVDQQVVDGSGHLFHGQLEALREAVHRSIRRLLPEFVQPDPGSE